MSPANPRLSNAQATKWAYAFIALYAAVGHFAGAAYSSLASVALTTVGLAVGWWVAKKLAAASALAKGAALVAPLALLLLGALLLRLPAGEGQRVKARELNGTWASQGTAKAFTVRLAGDSAWLSQAMGPQNVSFQAVLQHDSLVLQADEVDPLVFRVARDTARKRLVLVSDGVNFLRVEPQ